MSKTPLITKNDGTNWNDAVPKLRTDELGGTSTDWVQDDDTKADRLNVTANGTYTAASAGKYGYDYVTVSVPGTGATGTGTDGEIHHVEPDPETGELVDTVLPSSIEVTTPPTNTDYVDGETIDYSGIVVTAYLASGEVWEDENHPGGVIPFNELIFPVTVADADPNGEWSDGAGVNAVMLTYTPHTYLVEVFGRIEDHTIYVDGRVWGKATSEGKEMSATLKGNGPGTLLATRYNGYNYFASISGDKYVDTALYHVEPISENNKIHGWYGYGATSPLSNHNVFERGTWKDILTDFPVSTADPTQVDIGNMYCVQDIPVNWQRPGDGAVLEASFPINVTPATT